MRTPLATRGRQAAAVLGLLGALFLVASTIRATAALDARDQRLRAVCHQYAALDLSGLASLCEEAGYQEWVYVQPSWPYLDTIAPEDLDRLTTPGG